MMHTLSASLPGNSKIYNWYTLK